MSAEDWKTVREDLEHMAFNVPGVGKTLAALARLESQARGHAQCERAHTERAQRLKERVEAAEAERDALREFEANVRELLGRVGESGGKRPTHYCAHCLKSFDGPDATNEHARSCPQSPVAKENAALRAALAAILSSPWNVDEATVPRGGAEVAPEQVVGTLHVGLLKLRAARAALGDA